VTVAVRRAVDKLLVGKSSEDVVMTTSEEAIVVLTGMTMVSAGGVTTTVLWTGTTADEDTMVMIPLSEASVTEVTTASEVATAVTVVVTR
jgi:hypothetical protein